MTVLPEVSNLSKEDLEDLLNSEEKLDDFVENLPQLNAIRNQCEKMIDANLALASKWSLSILY